eukprot:2938603-Ditylum_brightwellii.AAC.1
MMPTEEKQQDNKKEAAIEEEAMMQKRLRLLAIVQKRLLRRHWKILLSFPPTTLKQKFGLIQPINGRGDCFCYIIVGLTDTSKGVLTRNAVDISVLQFAFWQPIEFINPDVMFPD